MTDIMSHILFMTHTACLEQNSRCIDSFNLTIFNFPFIYINNWADCYTSSSSLSLYEFPYDVIISVIIESKLSKIGRSKNEL